MTNRQAPRPDGFTLLPALALLLVLSALASAGMRSVALETRLTGHLAERQRLLAAAAAGISDAERRIRQAGPLEPRQNCGDICLLARQPGYPADFSERQAYLAEDAATLDYDVYWYALAIPGGEREAETATPEYGSLLQGEGIFHYEINSRAENGERHAGLRSTLALDARGRIEHAAP
ncbi:pilus assembly protein PilX [Stutzerimonas kirkiae]|uniref:pilus assembly protein PilX n=1 Tax=Stutzerimonas kirkiae TaxID=2211392 RepID=UPI0013F17009|nr:pilus assembly protein PilX [Stutzerimonas kirkiae]